MNPTVYIKENIGGTFYVRYNNKIADFLTYEEMLGLVTQLTIPKDRRCMDWLKTREQIEQKKKSEKEKIAKSRKTSLIELFESMIPLTGMNKEELLKKTRKRAYADKRAAIACVLLDKGYTSYDIAAIMGLAPPSIRHYGTSMRFNIQKIIKELDEKMEQ